MEKVSFGNNALKFGLFISAFSIVLTLIYYIFDVELFSWSSMAGNIIVGLLVIVSFFVFGVKSYRDKALGGVITFGQAFLQALAIGVIGYVIIGIFNYVFYAFIAPEYLNTQLEGFTAFMESFNMPEEALEKALSDFEAKMTPMKQLISAIQSGAIMSIIVGLIVAASIKKDTTQGNIA